MSPRPQRKIEDCKTAAEKHFIDELGNWHKRSRSNGSLRLRCLLGYRDSIIHRKNWGDINRSEIIRYLNRALKGYGIAPLATGKAIFKNCLFYNSTEKSNGS